MSGTKYSRVHPGIEQSCLRLGSQSTVDVVEDYSEEEDDHTDPDPDCLRCCSVLGNGDSAW